MLFICCSGVFFASHAQNASPYNIIPYPASLKPLQGQFVINKKTTLSSSADNDLFKNEANLLRQMIQSYLGKSALQPVVSNSSTNNIALRYDASIKDSEAYTIHITPQFISLSASKPAGMFMAMETLRQLMPADVENRQGNEIAVPCVTIEDKPAFPWRGMMLDVARHFFPVSYVKKYIDMMALYKMNKLHLHLTDDQGWRIEIKQYPELTEQGAWRTFNNQDSNCMRLAKETGNTDFNIDTTHIIHKNGKTLYGGFYTQEEIKDIIRYAAARHIDVIPEIDMPGHMATATHIYSNLLCEEQGGNSALFTSPLCPCNENVFTFARNVYTEIAALFPSTYMHIGGDEVERSAWAQSPECKDFMTTHHIKGIEQLQSYFTNYMDSFFHSKGKTLIGWDEIVEGGINASAVVMWWRVWAKETLLHAAKNGNNIIMTPDGPFYFDAFPDQNSLSEVYHYPLIPKAFTAAQTKYITGGQANLWTEQVPSEQRADYLVMPRLTALAESVWSNDTSLYASYLQRLSAQYPRLEDLHVNYRLPDLGTLPVRSVFIHDTAFFIPSPLKDFSIHYTTNGSLPTAASPALSRPLNISQSVQIKLALFTPAGRRGDVYTLNFDKQTFAASVQLSNATPGLQCDYYNGSFPTTTAIKKEADSSFKTPDVSFNKDLGGKPFALKFTGYINVPQTAVYNFYLTSDDGSVLYIANRLVVDNDGLHSAKEKSGQVALTKGLQPITVNFIEGGGGYTLKLKYSIGNEAPKDIPDSWLVSK
ncbi:family 20 glycosylhydrolase [Ilyomonas limi]|uniref:family 20 glycosylhydrolase n=1 Tax=Ilyomonas limi TaxID=2575867 RepID=UPI0021D2D8A6|nr:family 20 glycosylhydrolase [Ilyomonas limi]